MKSGVNDFLKNFNYEDHQSSGSSESDDSSAEMEDDCNDSGSSSGDAEMKSPAYKIK